MSYNPQAVELNTLIESKNSAVYKLLSDLGRGAFFPKKGILGQAAQAKNCKINATIGISLEEDGSTMCLPFLADKVDLDNAREFKYAPSFGVPELREVWQKMIVKKSPTLKGKEISLPVVTSALTHGIYVAGQLFADSVDSIICPNFYWGNYNLALSSSTGADLKKFETFVDDEYNTQGLKDALNDGGVGKKLVILNFPNNPTGYTPTIEEAKELRELFIEEAQKGSKIAVIIDDAYFGLVFRDGVFEESIFGLLTDAHENILAIKVDGATKEDYAWGFRTGFLTYGVKGGDRALYQALEEKSAAVVRASISNASNMSQQLLLDAYRDPSFDAQKREKYLVLKSRFDRVEDILNDHPEFLEMFKPMPFNSGYFMCVKPKEGIDAEELRMLLVEKYSVGTITTAGLIRVAFSSTANSQLEEVFSAIYSGCKELA